MLLPTSTQPDDLAELSARKSGTIPVMDSLKNLQVIRIAMLASVVFYGVIATLVPSNAEPNPVVFYAFAAIAIMEVVGIFGLRRAISPQTATLSPPVSVKPQTALIIIYPSHFWWENIALFTSVAGLSIRPRGL